jgi:uncharacterized protein
MRPSGHGVAGLLIVMAKVPVMGRVKTRLARQVGAATALRFYRTTLKHVVGRLNRDPRFRTVLSISPDSDRFSRALPNQTRRIGQGRGDLGQRMQRLFDQAAPGPVILIGTDIPAIDPAIISRAFRALGAHEAVFGPADDGGYWLVGLRRRTRTRDMFENVRWSTEHTLADTLRNLSGLSVGFVETLSDVDAAADLASQDWCIGRRVVGGARCP